MDKLIHLLLLSFFLISCATFKPSKLDKTGTPKQSLTEAARAGNLTRVKELLKSDDVEVDFTSHDFTALMEASQEGHLEIVKVLLAAGADVNYQVKQEKIKYIQ